MKFWEIGFQKINSKCKRLRVVTAEILTTDISPGKWNTKKKMVKCSTANFSDFE